jgi:hypothetical protein
MIGKEQMRNLIKCYFEEESDILDIKRGEEIIVVGKCAGKQEGTGSTPLTIVLKQCNLMHNMVFELVNLTITSHMMIKYEKFGPSIIFELHDPLGNIISTQKADLKETDGEVKLSLTSNTCENPIEGTY